MTLHALDDIDDALAATRSFLWPPAPRRWAKLALVVLFTGGVGGVNPFQFGGGSPPGGTGGTGLPTDPGAIPDVGPEVWAIVAAVVALGVAIGVVFLVVGSIMEFVLVEALRRESVTLRRYWGERWRQGLRLAGFRLILGLLTLAVVGAGIALALAPVVLGVGPPSVLLILLAVLLFVVVAVLSGLLHGFTTVFVVPVMVGEDRRVLSAWRRFWPTVTGQWRQYLAYALMGFVLQLAAGLLVGIVLVVLGIAIAIPFAIVGLAGLGLLEVAATAGWVVVGLAIAAYVLVMIAVAAVASVPVQVFLRYYALLVLGDTNEAFDLIAERRRAIREPEAA